MSDSSLERVNAEEVPEVPPPARMPLATVDEVRVEMAKVYREVRRKTMAPELGTKLVYMLVQLARVTEVATVERRLREIEALLKNGGEHV